MANSLCKFRFGCTTLFLQHLWHCQDLHLLNMLFLGFDGGFQCLFSPLDVFLPRCLDKDFVAVDRRDSLAFCIEIQIFSGLVLYFTDKVCCTVTARFLEFILQENIILVFYFQFSCLVLLAVSVWILPAISEWIVFTPILHINAPKFAHICIFVNSFTF